MANRTSAYLVLILTYLCAVKVAFSEQVANESTCDGLHESETWDRIKVLEEKLDKILDLLQTNGMGLNQQEFWKGNHSTFGSFKRLSNDAKGKLRYFHLENTEDLDVTKLIDLLRPCTHLESIKLNHVELLGNFPNSSDGKLTLPKLYEFELILDSFPTLAIKTIFSSVIFAQKEHRLSNDVTVRQIFEMKANIKIVFSGYTKFSINQDFGELILDSGNGNILESMDSNVFQLKKLTVDSASLPYAQIPLDLTYLNLNGARFKAFRLEADDLNEFLKKLRKLKAVHLVGNIDSDVLDLSALPPYLREISLARFNLNRTDKVILPELETILLNNCVLTEDIIDNLHRFARKIKTVAVIFDFTFTSGSQCHQLLYNLVMNDVQLRKLESVFITGCFREHRPDLPKPKHYDRMEEFLTNLGLGKSTKFLLERQVNNEAWGWVWRGKNATAIDEKLVKYQLSSSSKLRSWENYKDF